MRIEVKRLTSLRFSRMTRFDLHEEFGLAHLVEDKGDVTIYFNDSKCRTWGKEEHPNIWTVKWFDANHVALYLHGPKIAIVSATTWEQRELGYLSELYLSSKFMLASYGYEQFYSSGPDDLERHHIAVFLRDGTFEFGIRDLMDKDRDSWKLEEVTAGYTFENNFSFVAYDSPLLWILNVADRIWKKVPFAFSAVKIDVLTGDDKKAYAIYDHRRLLQHYPDRPPFELAVFDLASETAAKQDFAPVETALTGAGFAMSEIKFQPNSTGRIIVSDSKQAALLEFCEPKTE
jgi:hypothetical protein